VRVFHAQYQRDLIAILQAMHLALRSTRGAAVALSAIDVDAQVIRHAGIGNISAVVWVAGVSRGLMSHNGIVGHEARKFQELAYPFPRSATLVLHSDGLATRWNLDGYPGLVVHDPALLAGVLYRDFQRERDDVTILVARATGEAQP